MCGVADTGPMASSDADDSASLEFLFSEAEDHLVEVVSAIRETSARAESVVRFNVLVLGLVVTAVSVLVQARGLVGLVPTWVLGAVGAGFGALLGSTLFAVLSYLKRGVAVGLDADDMVSAAGQDLGRDEVVLEALYAYRDGIIRNEEILSIAAGRFRWSLWLLITGVVLLASASTGLLWAGGT